ncbi:MAG: hypothetical protein A3E74_07640 [Omnitrophica bacterium RIFCSPHIGHO2_12_FULL_44_12]|nr:MAG: hypothetical protein A3E74_07640 [Omnitrophica bacterium RIFCSPHIGHO2_12_FULL_44_12]
MNSNTKPKKSLYVRVFSLVIIPSTLLMIAFIVIQLGAETRTIQQESTSRAQFASYILHEKLTDLQKSGLSPSILANKIEEISKPLITNGLLNYMIIFQPDGKIDRSLPASINVDPYDTDKIRELEVSAKLDHQWLYSYANRKQRKIDVYLPIMQNNEMVLVYKTSFSLGKISEAIKRSYISIWLTALVILSIVFYLTRSLAKHLVSPLLKLNEASQEIMAENFSKRVDVNTGDEIEILANTFNHMAEKIAEMKMIAQNANPLTHLPGNIAIESDISRRIKFGAKFVVIHSDLDNFKAFNDAYGIEKGDQAIKLTAQILKDALEAKGTQTDFLGHEGGDDFVVVTTPKNAESITNYIIKEFDEKIKLLYNEKDRQNGYIMGHERRASGESEGTPLTRIPLMSISLAGISNENLDFASYAEITNRLVEMKHKAKEIRGRVFICKR